MAEELATLARPYAEAVFELAKEVGGFDMWSENLSFMSAAVQDPQIKSIIANPRIDKDKLIRILLDICDVGQVSEASKNLMRILIDYRRLRVLPQIAVQYEELKAQHQGHIKVELKSAYYVTPLQQQEIEAVLQKRLGKAIDMTIILDQSLVGGWIVRAGDQVVDLSARGRLEQLATELRR